MATDELPPIDDFGRPTTYLSYRLLKYMYKYRNESYTPRELSGLLCAKHSDVKLLFRQLKKLDFIVEDLENSQKFRYNLNCKNVELQAEFESYLVEVLLKSLPVHRMVDYSPSYRQKSIGR